MTSFKVLCFFLLSFLTIVLADEYHQKARRKDKNLEYKDIDPILKELEGYNEFWDTKAQSLLEEQLKFEPNTKKAKNIILFIADGLSITTTAAARMYMGGEEKQLSYEKFSHFGFARTYCVDHQVASSSCAANALMHGVKNNRRGIGVSANVLSSQCHFDEDDRTYSIAKWAQEVGKATGLVTNTRVTHATPASVYAHVSERDWENNDAISQECRSDSTNSNVDIAYQLVHNDEAKPFNVILGGGRRQFLNTTMLDDEGESGSRTDGRNLINEWLSERNKVGKAEYIWHKKQLEELDVSKTDYLLGLFESDHLMYRLDILNNNLQSQEPQLSDLTRTAIKMLEKEEKGFFLMVEGGKIDMAHHDSRPRKALDETVEFARAIELAKTLTNEEETLIVVSSDHSHVFTYNGYPWRHRDVLGLVDPSLGTDRLPYETLSYANGPGYDKTYTAFGRADLSSDDFTELNRQHASGVPLDSESHAGEDIAIYANGPWSHLFQGSYEQSVVGHAMAYAAKIGPYLEEDDDDENDADAANTIYLYPIILFISILSSILLK